MSSSLNSSNTKLKVGDVVEVLSPEEICRTLDENGSLEGLPFMPEMVQHCGRRARLSCRALKTCVECLTDKRFIDMRGFGSQDVWVLDDLRCSGADHDGCQRGCLIFWKSAWLRQVEVNEQPAKPLAADTERLLRKLKTKTAPDRYFCQSTELVKATQPLSLMGRLKLCSDDVRFGNVGVFKIIAQIASPIFWKTFHKYIVPRHVIGQLTRTPLVKLELRAGEMVEVKSSEEIAQTLNTKGFNRGLRYDRGLNQFCGNRFQVRDRLDKMIIESTGQMVRLEGTVTLENSSCLCRRTALGGCPRKDFVYWREAWLKRANGQASPAGRRHLPKINDASAAPQPKPDRSGNQERFLQTLNQTTRNLL
jgi:hypothetical protein